MPPIPVLRPSEAIKVFKMFGWEIARQHGSHIIMTKVDSFVTLSIPKHPTVARGTLRSLIRKADIKVEDFIAALQN